MNKPRMRTAPQCIEAIKEIDPDTAFTLRALRRMMNTGEIPVVNIRSKRLVNLDVLLEYLSCSQTPTVEQTKQESNYGKIRRVV